MGEQVLFQEAKAGVDALQKFAGWGFPDHVGRGPQLLDVGQELLVFVAQGAGKWRRHGLLLPFRAFAAII